MTTFFIVYLIVFVSSNVTLALIAKTSKGMRDFWRMKRKDVLMFFVWTFVPVANVILSIFFLIAFVAMVVEKINTSKFWDEEV